MMRVVPPDPARELVGSRIGMCNVVVVVVVIVVRIISANFERLPCLLLHVQVDRSVIGVMELV